MRPADVRRRRSETGAGGIERGADNKSLTYTADPLTAVDSLFFKILRKTTMELPEDESGWLEFFIRDCIKNRVGDDMLFFVTENAHKKDGNSRVILRRFGKQEKKKGRKAKKRNK